MNKALFIALFGLIMSLVPMDVCYASTSTTSGNVAPGKELFNKLVKYADQWDHYNGYDLTSLSEDEMRRAVGVIFEASKVFKDVTELNKKLTKKEETELSNYINQQLKAKPGTEEKIQRLKKAIETAMT